MPHSTEISPLALSFYFPTLYLSLVSMQLKLWYSTDLCTCQPVVSPKLIRISIILH